MDGQKCNNESEETYKKGGSKCVSKHSRDPSLLSSLSMVNKLVFICIISLVIGHAFAHEWQEHHEKHGKKSHDKKTHEKKSHKKKSKEKKGKDDFIQNPIPHDWFPVSNDPITTLGKGVGATNPLTGMESGADTTGSEVYDGAGVQVSYSSSSSSSKNDFYPGDVKAESDKDFLQFLGATGQYDTSSTSSSSSDSSSDVSSDLSSKASGGAKSDDVETNFKGKWEIHSANAGISGMHLMLLPNNKAIMFDSTVLGKSELQFPPGSCPLLNGVIDCYAHAAEYDIETAQVRPLRVHTDTWCSSGGVTVEGVLVQAGGYQGGGRVVRTLEMCETCDFVEHGESLSRQRWYSTQQALPDGRFIVVGGRDDTARSYEIIPPIGVKTPLEQNFKLPFLVETTDTFPGAENNLYPHVHLSSDGNLFIFANYKSILYNYEKHQVVRRFPDLPGGARNYPGSAPSALLPIKIPRDKTKKIIPVEVAICGGAPREAFQVREQKNQYLTALKSCGRIKITDPNSKWKMEQMPGPRLMGDMLILPTGDLIIVNGAKKGSAGWEYAEDPYYSPVIYRPSKPKDKRFAELAPSKIARMYHSSAIVLPDGKVLVAGSNTHARYDYAAKYPTELRVEKFSPPYLDPSLAMYAPTILSDYGQTILKYGQDFEVNVRMLMEAKSKDLKVTMYSPAFTTHGISMNQRLCVLPQIGVSGVPASTTIKVRAPPSGAVAPPGYYMLFVVHRGVPSKSVWIRIKN